MLVAPEWIVDGDYQRKLGDEVLKQAETAIWLDLPLRLSLARMWKRTSHRVRNQVELSHGNRMSWNVDLLRWLQWEVRSHMRRRLKMPRRLARYGHLEVVRLRSQRQVDNWLAEYESARFVKPSEEANGAAPDKCGRGIEGDEQNAVSEQESETVRSEHASRASGER